MQVQQIVNLKNTTEVKCLPKQCKTADSGAICRIHCVNLINDRSNTIIQRESIILLLLMKG